MKNKMFQPGVILHEVIVGAFRAKGTSLGTWCKQNDVLPSTARLATYGQSGGERGQQLLNKMIEDAGEKFVEAAYRHRMLDEAKKLRGHKAKAKAEVAA